jgi:hypothetical protein
LGNDASHYLLKRGRDGGLARENSAGSLVDDQLVEE